MYIVSIDEIPDESAKIDIAQFENCTAKSITAELIRELTVLAFAGGWCSANQLGSLRRPFHRPANYSVGHRLRNCLDFTGFDGLVRSG